MLKIYFFLIIIEIHMLLCDILRARADELMLEEEALHFCMLKMNEEYKFIKLIIKKISMNEIVSTDEECDLISIMPHDTNIRDTDTIIMFSKKLLRKKSTITRLWVKKCLILNFTLRRWEAQRI